MPAFVLFRIFAYPICKNYFRKKILCRNEKMNNWFFVLKLPKMDFKKLKKNVSVKKILIFLSKYTPKQIHFLKFLYKNLNS